ncbi:TIGR02996 domain-containing protein [Lignipirellula cremea]|uniref:Leucine Rich repeats (2 copies) n=1 Tax=Lignipirellula cremea TaxID=2528010 RepID=A0A518E169_9BACT|nr:TIGR02996 domain-containing protein [Lignipirellula cremea]QDU97814.1 Leucine Rich repeats (2 copies) [Lignipirellula cremea]
MDSREQELLAAIRAEPDADPPRLAYGDWCEDWGDPRGEFIRLQCELSRVRAEEPALPLLQIREAMMLQEYEAAWIDAAPQFDGMEWGIDPWSLNHVFHPHPMLFLRGFLEAATFADCAAFAREQEKVFSRTLLRQVRLEKATPGSLHEVLEARDLFRLRGLHLCNLKLTHEDALALTRSPALSKLTHLGLSQNAIGAAGVKAICSSPHLRKLRWLDLADNDLNDKAAAPLLDWRPLRKLQFLDLGGNLRLERTHVEIIESGLLRDLHMLSAWQVGQAAAVVAALARAKSPARLTHLLLARNRLDDEPIVSLLQSSAMQSVRVLWLEYNWLGAESIKALAESPYCSEIDDLNLGYNAVGDEGARALAASPYLSHLRVLNLRMNPLSDKGLLALAESSQLASLEMLHVGGIEIKPATRELLVRRFGPGLAE